MASSHRDRNGNAVIQFIAADRRRRSIRLGKLPDARVEIIRQRVGLLRVSQQHGHPLDAETMAWLVKMSDGMHAKLAAVGLVSPRLSTLLGTFLDAYIATRTDVEQRTRENLEIVARRMKEYFGADRPLLRLTPADGKLFRVHLLKSYAEATVAASIRKARQMMRAAIDAKLIEDNPFRDVKVGSMTNEERQVHISRADIDRCIDASPDLEWKLIIALSRYGGLRCPSETLTLAWTDINWERSRMTVRSPKTGTRIVPIFPELLPRLEECFEAAEPGAVHVITRYRRQDCNLRTTFLKIIHRAGLKPWPKLFHNLRASRETELAAEFPIHVVCAWIGNTVAVAKAHYLTVREEDFDRAQFQSAAKSGAVRRFLSCTDRQEQDPDVENAMEMATLQQEKREEGIRNKTYCPGWDSNISPESSDSRHFPESAAKSGAVPSPVVNKDMLDEAQVRALLELHIRAHLQGDHE